MESSTGLSDFLASRGFQRHPLVVNGVGHLQLLGELAGRPVDVLLDTGAASTVVDLAYCREQNLPLRDTGKLGGGAGGVRLPIYAIPEASLVLAGRPLRSDGIYALDLGHVNEGLVQGGATPVHAILGADVLTRHRAVIDYAEGALYLRPAEPGA